MQPPLCNESTSIKSQWRKVICSHWKLSAEMIEGRQYILEDSCWCLDGGYTFLTSTIHHLHAWRSVRLWWKHIFCSSRRVIIVQLLMLSFLLFLTFLTLSSIFLSQSKHLACIASLQLDILTSKPLLQQWRTFIVIWKMLEGFFSKHDEMMNDHQT